MVWGEDMVLKNDYLVDGSYAIALTTAECSCLRLESLMGLLPFYPAEAATVKRCTNKLTLIRGIRKIAHEVKERQRGLMSRNDYVKSLIAKFEASRTPSSGTALSQAAGVGDGEAGVQRRLSELTPYNEGDNKKLDRALRGLGGSSYGASGTNSGFPAHAGVIGIEGMMLGGVTAQSNGRGGGGASIGAVSELTRTVAILGRRTDVRFNELGDQNQAAINEMRHITR